MTDQPCSAAAEHRRQQKRGGGGGDDDDYKNEGDGGSGGSLAVAEAEARRWWLRRLDHPLHGLTPLPAQAGGDAAGVHPPPAATTALFGSGFLANLVQRPQAGPSTDRPTDPPTNRPTDPLNN